MVKPLSTSLCGRQHCEDVYLEAENRKIEEVEGTELSGVEEGEDGMSDEEGAGTARLGGGPRNKPTQ